MTGGIGAGKSTLAEILGERGAEVIDVDAIGREVIAAGAPGGDAVKATFGTTDRAELAGIVFSNPSAREQLEAISWPLIEAELERRIAAASAPVVVLDMAVLPQGLGKGLYGPVVTVEAADDIRVNRLVGRGMPEADARARMKAQTSEATRRNLADYVIINDGDRQELVAAAETLLQSLRDSMGAGDT